MTTLALGCASEAPETESPYIPLEGALLARRISLDLRGVVPTADESRRAEAEGVDTLVSEWLDDPRFEARLVDAFAEDWLLRVDELRVHPDEFALDMDEFAFTRAFGDEPAHVMARVAAEDRPWTEIVTGDWTMANEALSQLVPVAFTDPTDPAEWKEARYTDGRPAGGVLMTSGLWMRYHTTLFNYNRGRAAALSRFLLCYDFLDRPVHFTANVGSSTDELQAATQTEPGCVACHSGLDPLASTLFGFWPFEDKDGRELVGYPVERERYGEEALGLAPAYFGAPLQGAAQLGPSLPPIPDLKPARSPAPPPACGVASPPPTKWGTLSNCGKRSAMATAGTRRWFLRSSTPHPTAWVDSERPQPRPRFRRPRRSA